MCFMDEILVLVLTLLHCVCFISVKQLIQFPFKIDIKHFSIVLYMRVVDFVDEKVTNKR